MIQSKTQIPGKMKVKRKTAKRELPRIVYNVRSVEEYLQYASHDQTKDLIFRLALESIDYGIAEGKDTADIFCLPGVDGNSVYSVSKKEWKAVLKSAIDYYSYKKQYEKCIDCQQMINALQ